MGLELDMAIVLQTIKVRVILIPRLGLRTGSVSETYRALHWNVLPVCVDAGVLLLPWLAPPGHHLRAAGSAHVGLLAWRGKQQLLGKNISR